MFGKGGNNMVDYGEIERMRSALPPSGHNYQHGLAHFGNEDGSYDDVSAAIRGVRFLSLLISTQL